MELIENGEPVDQQTITADGQWNNLKFNYQLEKSSWIAIRIPYSVHTNPIFVEIGGKPISIKRSVEWCRASVDQCWDQKSKRFKEEEMEEARAGYDYARAVYDKILANQ